MGLTVQVHVIVLVLNHNVRWQAPVTWDMTCQLDGKLTECAQKRVKEVI